MPRILRGEGAEGTKGGRETSRGSAGGRSQSLALSEGRRQAAEDREPAPRQAAALTGRRGRRGRAGGPAGTCRSRACGVDAEAALEAALEVERSSKRPRDQTTGAGRRGRSRAQDGPERAPDGAGEGGGLNARPPRPPLGRAGPRPHTRADRWPALLPSSCPWPRPRPAAGTSRLCEPAFLF